MIIVVDYCQLIKIILDEQKIIKAYEENGDEVERITVETTYDVQFNLPPKCEFTEILHIIVQVLV